jgi:hypothetical protein
LLPFIPNVIGHQLAASGALVAVKRIAVDPVYTAKILPVFSYQDSTNRRVNLLLYVVVQIFVI